MIKYPFLVKKFLIPVSLAIPLTLSMYNIDIDVNQKKNMDDMIKIIQIQRM